MTKRWNKWLLTSLGVLIVAWSWCSVSLPHSNYYYYDNVGRHNHQYSLGPPPTTRRTINNHRHNHEKCSKLPPGYNSQSNNKEELNSIGYHNLLKIREHVAKLNTIQNNTSPTIFCIFPASFNSPQIQLAARKAFGRDCNGSLVVSNETTASPTAQTNNRSDNVTPITDVIEKDADIPDFLLAQIQKGVTFDWYYVAQPNVFFFPTFARKRIDLLHADIQNQPSALRSYRFKVNQFPNNNDAAGSCERIALLNRWAMNEIFGHHNHHHHNKEDTSLSSLLDKPFREWLDNRVRRSYSIQCVKGIQRRRTNPHKYSEVELPDGDNISRHITLERVGQVLDGSCDHQWEHQTMAKDVKGTSGYVHDVTWLSKHPPPFTFSPLGHQSNVCSAKLGEGPEGKHGIQALQKIQLSKSHQNTRVLCMVYSHESRHDRVRAIAETWGKDCDGFLAASTKTDLSIGAVQLSHEGEEEYENMWMKIKSMWQYAYDHYRHDFDWFTIGGDDHYFIPSNFRYASEVGTWAGPYNMTSPLLLGGSIADPSDRSTKRYCGGGSGYALNRRALEVLITQLFPKADCWPHWRSSQEDRILSGCFRSVGVLCSDTNDLLNETRYHPWNADFHVQWTHQTLANYYPKTLEKAHGIVHKERLGQISKSSVSFHLKPLRPDPSLPPDSGMRRYHALLYGLCPG